MTVTVTWVARSPDEIAASSLVDAFEAFTVGRYEAAVVPANVAVETKLDQLLTEVLQQAFTSKKGKENVENFLTDGATYGHQLNVLLPFLAARLGAPSLDERIMGKLRRLKALRNDMAHRGAPARPLGRDETAECLCAALFGVHYLQVVRPFLLLPKGDGS